MGKESILCKSVAGEGGSSVGEEGKGTGKIRLYFSCCHNGRGET